MNRDATLAKSNADLLCQISLVMMYVGISWFLHICCIFFSRSWQLVHVVLWSEISEPVTSGM
jgi:hypothetical protein